MKRYQDERLQREEQNWNTRRQQWLKEMKTEVDSINREFNKENSLSFLKNDWVKILHIVHSLVWVSFIE